MEQASKRGMQDKPTAHRAAKQSKTEPSKDEQIQQLQELVAQQKEEIAARDLYISELHEQEPDIDWDEGVPKILKNNREFMLHAFKADDVSWNYVKEFWMDDPEFALFALYRGKLETLEEAPCLTRSVLLDALQKGVIMWSDMDIPGADSLRSDIEFGRSVILSCPKRVVIDTFEVVLAIFPELRNDPQVWEAVLAAENGFSLPRIYHSFAPGFILEDREMMLEAIKKSPDVLAVVGRVLRDDDSFVTEAIQKNVEALSSAPEYYLDRSPRFVAEQFDRIVVLLARDDCDFKGNLVQLVHDLIKKLGTRLSTENQLSTAWFAAGLPIDSSPVFDPWRADKEKLLVIAKRWPGHNDYWWSNTFRYASEAVRNDPEFMMQAMECDPCLFRYASESIRTTNFEMAMRALSSMEFVRTQRSFEYARGYVHPAELPGLEMGLESHRARAESQLALLDSFINPFLCSLQLSDKMEVKSSLNKKELKILIAEFLGVPRGRLLQDIRQALQNLSRQD